MPKGTLNMGYGAMLGIVGGILFNASIGIDGYLFMSIVLIVVSYDNFMQGFYEMYSYEEVDEVKKDI